MKLFLASSPDISSEQLAALLRMVGKEKANKVLIITTAVVPYGLDPKPEWVNRAIEPLRSIANELVETSLEDGELIPEDLSQYDFVFVTGGNVFYLAYRLEETGFGDSLRKYVEDGCVYAGSSAGSAILMCDLQHFATADDSSKAPRICQGIGLIEEAIIVHANHEKYATIMIDIATSYTEDGLEVIKINDGEVLVVEGESKKFI
jgi:dipeptidase E